MTASKEEALEAGRNGGIVWGWREENAPTK